MADEPKPTRALFPDLVYGEDGERADVVYVGGEVFYAVPDAGFRWHVPVAKIDDAVIAQLQDQVMSMQDDVVAGMLEALGSADIFTKAAVDASLRNLGAGIRAGNPDQWVPWLQLFGFRVVVDMRGNIVRMIYPEAPSDDE